MGQHFLIVRLTWESIGISQTKILQPFLKKPLLKNLSVEIAFNQRVHLGYKHVGLVHPTLQNMQRLLSNNFSVDHVFYGFVKTTDFLSNLLEPLPWVRNLTQILETEELSPVLDPSPRRL